MHEIVGPLMPPNTPVGLPHGRQRGGIFDAGYVPMTYIDASRPTVPTDSPYSPDVSEDVFMQKVPFSDPSRDRVITGGERQFVMSGYGGFGQHIQGMGPTPGFIRERVGPAPMPINYGHPVQTPHGLTEGGIFGSGAVMTAMATGPMVPQRRTTSFIPGYNPQGIAGYRGFGAGPDGLGH